MTDRLVQVFADTLRIDAAQISDETSPDNTPQWDSLATVKLAVAISAAFSIKLSNAEVVAMRNFGLVRTILQRKGVPAEG
jgi:acyl carrier protein